MCVKPVDRRDCGQGPPNKAVEEGQVHNHSHQNCGCQAHKANQLSLYMYFARLVPPSPFSFLRRCRLGNAEGFHLSRRFPGEQGDEIASICSPFCFLKVTDRCLEALLFRHMLVKESLVKDFHLCLRLPIYLASVGLLASCLILFKK